VEIFGVIMGMMVTIAFGVGTLIVGMVLYTATMDRRQEYGVLKALGARNRHLYLLVTVQALTATGLGLLLGLGLTWVAAWAISAAYPQFGIALVPARIVNVALVSLGMGLLAALLPARMVAQLDPAQVFRGL
jgi:putative ABC transport system permease protein